MRNKLNNNRIEIRKPNIVFFDNYFSFLELVTDMGRNEKRTAESSYIVLGRSCPARSIEKVCSKVYVRTAVNSDPFGVVQIWELELVEDQRLIEDLSQSLFA